MWKQVILQIGKIYCRNLTENFTYNNLDQLTSWQAWGTTYNIGYKTDGTSRIDNKTDAGTYVYGTQS